jgi:hypothetical protein
MKSLAGLRTRWAAIGAACAVALGAGGFGVVNAVVTAGSKGTYVPVTPTRVLDTRNTEEISGATHRLVIEGVVSLPDGTTRQIIPTDATAVSINITVTNGRKNGGYGYVTAFDCLTASDPVPNASAINFENRVDIANALNLATSSNGSICLYVFGTADLIVDVNGYYVDHNHDDRYYTEAETNQVIDNTLYFGTTGAFTNSYAKFSGTIDSFNGGTIAVDPNGDPLIVYRRGGTAKAWIAYCLNPLCTEATQREVDASNRGSAGQYSVLFSSGGSPMIVHRTSTQVGFTQQVRLILCAAPKCATSSTIVLSDLATSGPIAAAINPSGSPSIAYWGYADNTAAGNNIQTLRLITCQDEACAVFTDTAVTTTPYKTNLQLMFDGNGFPRFLYPTHTSITFLACLDSLCSNTNAQWLNESNNGGDSLNFVFGTIRGNGRPVLYGPTKIFDCSDSTCSSSTTRDHQLTKIMSAAASPDGDIIFTRGYGLTYLEVTRCETLLCSSSNTTVLDTGTGVRSGTIAFGLDGNPVVAYTIDDLLSFVRWAIVEPT